MFKWKNSIIGFIILFLLIASFSAQADVLKIQGVGRDSVDISRLPAKPEFKSAVSQQNLLGLERSGKSLLPQQSISQGDVRTLKIVRRAGAIRV